METNNQNRTLVAVFNDYDSAREAVRELENDGISKQDIDIRSNLKATGAGYSDDTYDRHEESGIAAWWHRTFGGDDDTATQLDDRSHYDEALRRGSAVVTVHPPESSYEQAIETLNQYGAVDIDRRVEAWRETGYSAHDPNAPAYTAEEAKAERSRFSNTGEAGPVPVIQEELQIGKRAVQKGGVRVYSRVIERPVEEQIQLREEHVRVERRPADRPVGADELRGLRDQTIEVTQMAEEAVVSKRARVVEEVFVGKESTERTETVRDSVRHTEVVVDELPGAASQNAAGRTADTGGGVAYGTRYALDPRFSGRSWDSVEQDLRTDYLRSNPNSTWDEVKADVRSGWDKATNRL